MRLTGGRVTLSSSRKIEKGSLSCADQTPKPDPWWFPKRKKPDHTRSNGTAIGTENLRKPTKPEDVKKRKNRKKRSSRGKNSLLERYWNGIGTPIGTPLKPLFYWVYSYGVPI